jgi:hypothetical protein
MHFCQQGVRVEIEQEVAAISASGLFDEVWYRNTYGDVPAGVDAIEHYVRVGAKLGRKPAPDVKRVGEESIARVGVDLNMANLSNGFIGNAGRPEIEFAAQ